MLHLSTGTVINPDEESPNAKEISEMFNNNNKKKHTGVCTELSYRSLPPIITCNCTK